MKQQKKQKPGLALAAATMIGLGSLKKLPAPPAKPATAGTIDPQKLIEASERLQKLIEDENENRAKRLDALNETAKQLQKASQSLLDLCDEKKQDGIRQADWRKQGCPATKPVTVGRPLKLKKPAAA